jgi:hypothetical protein
MRPRRFNVLNRFVRRREVSGRGSATNVPDRESGDKVDLGIAVDFKPLALATISPVELAAEPGRCSVERLRGAQMPH